MIDRPLVQALASHFGDLPSRGLEALTIVAIFVVGGFAYCLAYARRLEPSAVGFRGIVRFIFKPDHYRHVTARSDRINFFLTYVLWFPLMRTIISVVATIVSATIVYRWLAASLPASPVTISDPTMLVAFQVLVLFLCGEFCSYWTHRAMHRIPLLWSLHRVHHSSEALTIFTRLRDHPLDLLISALGKVVLAGSMAGLVLFLAGTAPDRTAMMLYFTAGSFIPYGLDVWRHCHLPITLGALNRVINAPVMHQIHHSAEERHWDKNMGAELMIFDWMFGTLYLPASDETYRWGLNDREIGANNPHLSMADFYLEPFRYARMRMRTRRATALGALAIKRPAASAILGK